MGSMSRLGATCDTTSVAAIPSVQASLNIIFEVAYRGEIPQENSHWIIFKLQLQKALDQLHSQKASICQIAFGTVQASNIELLEGFPNLPKRTCAIIPKCWHPRQNLTERLSAFRSHSLESRLLKEEGMKRCRQYRVFYQALRLTLGPINTRI